MKDNSEVSVEVKLMKLEIISIIWSYDTIYRTKVSWSIVQKYLGYDDWKCLATFSFLRGSCLFTRVDGIVMLSNMIVWYNFWFVVIYKAWKYSSIKGGGYTYLIQGGG